MLMYYSQGTLFDLLLPNREKDPKSYDRQGNIYTINLNLLRVDKGYFYYYNTIRDP